MDKKECTKCRKTKYIDQFSKTSNGNPKWMCKECKRDYNANYRKVNVQKDTSYLWEKNAKEHKEYCRELYWDRFYINPLKEHYAFKQKDAKIVNFV